MLRIFGVFWIVLSVLMLAIIFSSVIELIDDDLRDKDLRRERKN